MNKSSTEEIRQRFDQDVDRFSNLDSGQVSTLDAKFSLELLTTAAHALQPDAQFLLDIGSGAGNYTLMMLSKNKNLHCTLVDLSKPMLDRAFQRVSEIRPGNVEVEQGDIREIQLKENHFDLILAGAVLHHLRDDEDWEKTFQKIYRLLKPGGCLLVSDLVTQDSEILTRLIWEMYGDYLEESGGKDYRRKVLDYIDQEDSPRSLNYQINLMKNVGFQVAEVLHKKLCFGAYVGIK